MKSIKPGRGPSMMGAFSGIAAALFGVVWIVIAAAMGAWIMIPFGLIFIALSIGNAVYHYRNATRDHRYSAFDITEDGEEEDPLNARFGYREERGRNNARNASGEEQERAHASRRYCPSCGARVEGTDSYCRYCGTRL